MAWQFRGPHPLFCQVLEIETMALVPKNGEPVPVLISRCQESGQFPVDRSETIPANPLETLSHALLRACSSAPALTLPPWHVNCKSKSGYRLVPMRLLNHLP